MMSEWLEGNRPERVDGKTFEEWVAFFLDDFGEDGAWEAAAMAMGLGGDTRIIDEDGRLLPEPPASADSWSFRFLLVGDSEEDGTPD